MAAELTAGPVTFPPSVSGGIVLGEGAAWIRADQGSMARIGPSVREQTKFVSQTKTDRAFAAGEGAFWAGGDALQKFDPERVGEGPVDEVTLPGLPTGVAVGGGSVWVCTGGGNLLEINPSTGAVASEIAVGRQPTGLAVGEGSVWVTGADGTISRAFFGAPAVATTITVSGEITGIAVGLGSIWVTVDVP